jgi:serine/threonine-protein kinase
MTAPAAQTAPDPLVGSVIGRKYRIEQRLGGGAMGVVYRATAEGGAACAIKVMNADSAKDQNLRERFQREAVALMELKHPNLLEVRDYGFDPQLGLPFLVMELLEGRPLDEMVVEHTPDPATGLDLAKQVLRGLAHAHAQRVLHRDLKTENVYCTWDGTQWVAKLLDFGLVKFDDEKKWGTEKKLTMQGQVFGSPAYMSPEQGTGGQTDARSDVYSAGVMLFELITGSWPFEAESQMGLLKAHLLEPVPPLSSKREGLAVRPELEAVVKKAMAKKPSERFATAGEMLAALEAVPMPAAWIQGMTHVPPQPIAPAPMAHAIPAPSGGGPSLAVVIGVAFGAVLALAIVGAVVLALLTR